MNRLCKPVLGGMETSQPSNELARPDDSRTYITFDVPSSTSTTVADINLVGTVTGGYSDQNFVSHGFLRRLNGAITTFDAPGASSTYGGAAINDAGEIAGTYSDAGSLEHGFLRSPNGAITTFDIPGSTYGPYPGEINDAGVIAGTYWDENVVARAFVRSRNGAITTFDVPGAVNGTFASGLNLLGATTGSYENEDYVDHGYVRSPDGAITTFEVLSGHYTLPSAINLLGRATGAFEEPHPEVHFRLFRGFLREHDGTIEKFDAVPSPLDPCCTWTWPSSINLRGEIAGHTNDGHDVNHGFVRATDGAFTLLDAPGAGTGFNQGTFAVSINLLGVVAGYYEDANRLYHGFLWIRH
jgi:hypothetical protein